MGDDREEHLDTAKERETVETGHAAELWNLKPVIAHTGLLSSTLYLYVARGLFRGGCSGCDASVGSQHTCATGSSLGRANSSS